MTRYMADACNSAALPGWELQASYVDGICRVPRNDKVRISSLATNDGNVGDVEPGNPFWPAWINWVRQRRMAGVDPSLYCCDDNYGTTFFDGWRHNDGVAQFAAAGVPEPHWWVFNFNTSIPPDYAMAVQVNNNIQPGYDVSIVRDFWPGIDTVQSIMEDELFIFNGPDGVGYLVCQLGLVPLPNIDFANKLVADGVKWYGVDQANHDALLAAAAKLSASITGTVPVSLTGSGTLKVG